RSGSNNRNREITHLGRAGCSGALNIFPYTQLSVIIAAPCENAPVCSNADGMILTHGNTMPRSRQIDTGWRSDIVFLVAPLPERAVAFDTQGIHAAIGDGHPVVVIA